MKIYLLDTHIFLNAYMRPLQNGKKVTKIMEDPDAIKYINAITLMEVAQGASTGFTIISDDRKFPLYLIKLISND
jgi:PIN domain nuclease of toxin-antitoxin system